MGGAFFEALNAFGCSTRRHEGPRLLDIPADAGSDSWRPAHRDGLLLANHTGKQPRRPDRSGRDYLRVNLKATELGLAIHPQSQALQEFDAMAEHFRASTP
jgi:hypothetical protein